MGCLRFFYSVFTWSNCISLSSLSLSDYECHQEGSVYGYEYDQTTGVCACNAGWHGDKCGQGKLKPTSYSHYKMIRYS